MKYYKGTPDFKIEEPSAVSLGKFDGLHLGHKYLLEELKSGKKQGLKSVIFTFDIPPAAVHKPGYKVLSTNREKERIFERAGIDYVIECPFTEDLRRRKPYEFMKMLTEKIAVRRIAAGPDFRFGVNRSGGFAELKQYAGEFGYEAVLVDKLQHEGSDISSTRIRALIEQGKMEEANYLLGYDYFLLAKVEHGNEIGRTIGFPTANLIPPGEKLLPPNGVYISRVDVEGREYNGISNIGVKPTIHGHYPVSIETYLYDFDETIYGREIRVSLRHFLRPEQKFDSIGALKEQIRRDHLAAEDYLAHLHTRN